MTEMSQRNEKPSSKQFQIGFSALVQCNLLKCIDYR